MLSNNIKENNNNNQSPHALVLYESKRKEKSRNEIKPFQMKLAMLIKYIDN